MKVRKKGLPEKKKDVVIFVCENCKCEYEAEDDEYYVDSGMTSLSYPPQYICAANCPECHKINRAYKTKSITDGCI